MMKKFLIYITLSLFPLWIKGQSKENFDEFRKNLLNSYSTFHKTTMDNYKSFRDSVNIEYAKALNKPWNKKEIIEGTPIPEWDVTPIPPVIRDKQKDDVLPPIEQIPIVVVPTPIIKEQPQPYVPIIDDEKAVDIVSLAFDFNNNGSSLCK